MSIILSINSLRAAANLLKKADVPFLIYGIPLITVVGGGALLYLGLQGILKKRTYILIRNGATQNYQINGRMAVVSGVCYLLIFLVVITFLVPFSLALLGLL